MRSILRPQMTSLKNCQKLHKMDFQAILVTFSFDLKIDLIDLKSSPGQFPFSANLKHSSAVCFFGILQIVQHCGLLQFSVVCSDDQLLQYALNIMPLAPLENSSSPLSTYGL